MTELRSHFPLETDIGWERYSQRDLDLQVTDGTEQKQRKEYFQESQPRK